MATRKTTRKNASGVKPRRRATETYSARAKRLDTEDAAAKAAPPTTKEDLLAQIGAVLDQVDALMRDERPKTDPVQFSYASFGPTMKARALVDGLKRQLDGLLNPNGNFDVEGAEEAIWAAFAAPAGTVPSWAQPGEFLLWMSYIPVRCRWGGFATPQARFSAADANGLFP